MIQYKGNISRKVFTVFNYCFLIISAGICIFPFLHTLAVSLSSNVAVNAGVVKLLPVGFQLDAYEFIIKELKFYTAFGISIQRTVLGIAVNMLLTVLAAYSLSQNNKSFKGRQIYLWYFIITMLFNGGMIPTYLAVRYTGIMDTIWSLILPSAVPVFNIILLQNYFKALPKEISESAFMDGAGHWRILFQLWIPLSKAVLAMFVLFVSFNHWNSWFDGMIYMNRPENYPLQTYLQTIVVQVNYETVSNLNDLKNINAENSKTAQIIIAMVPILCVYPLIQKYFTTGIILGSVKG